MFIEQSLHTLRNNKQKQTKTRLWILKQLEHIKKPLNPYELLEQSHDKDIDITTIYRNLELFESLGIVHKVHSLGGYIPCTHDHKSCDKVHDMIICSSCHSIAETHLDSTIKKSLGLSAGAIELSGKCHQCS